MVLSLDGEQMQGRQSVIMWHLGLRLSSVTSLLRLQFGSVSAFDWHVSLTEVLHRLKGFSKSGDFRCCTTHLLSLHTAKPVDLIFLSLLRSA